MRTQLEDIFADSRTKPIEKKESLQRNMTFHSIPTAINVVYIYVIYVHNMLEFAMQFLHILISHLMEWQIGLHSSHFQFKSGSIFDFRTISRIHLCPDILIIIKAIRIIMTIMMIVRMMTMAMQCEIAIFSSKAKCNLPCYCYVHIKRLSIQ